MATATELSAPTAGTERPFDISTEMFSTMIERGVFPPKNRIFLRDGKLYEKISRTKHHGSVGAGVTMALAPRLPAGWSLWPESTIVLDDLNAPLPDFSVIRSGDLLGRANPERYPDPRDIGLLIEVAVTSLRKDLTTGLEQYARAGIPAYWVVDVLGRRLLAHSEPRTEQGRSLYARVETYQSGQSIPLVLDGVEVASIPFDEILRA
ncbi:MAG TPA: Uma2 family endonuclease [Isosphaeraceae bacterium]|nr:Uma2 family endonuclease [Isosphaeraceae bacterium]